MTSFTLRLLPETPTPNPSSRGVRGMGLATKPAKDLCKAVPVAQQAHHSINVDSPFLRRNPWLLC